MSEPNRLACFEGQHIYSPSIRSPTLSPARMLSLATSPLLVTLDNSWNIDGE